MNIIKLTPVGISIVAGFLLITFISPAKAKEIQWCAFDRSTGQQMGNACYQSLEECQRMYNTSMWTDKVCIAVQK